MQSTDFTHEEIVNYATLLFGSDWRTALAEKLNISRKQLVLTLASGDPVPENITIPFLPLVEQHLREREEEAHKLRERLVAIRMTNTGKKHQREARRTAS